MIQSAIPSDGRMLPAIGMGTWQTFDTDPAAEKDRAAALSSVLDVFYQQGGRLLDSSPMYGRAEAAIGALTKDLPYRDELFYATKVWTQGRQEGIRQMEASLRQMNRRAMDLIQIHNLVDWETHYATLQDWKAAGKVRYTGITHYTDDAHPALERVLRSHDFDFVQFNYSIFNRHAGERLLPAAAERGVATLINRPFGEGRLFARLSGQALPAWAGEWGISSWSQFLLKYIISHPAVTCAIPATANPHHAADNMEGGKMPLPDGPTRRKMVAWISNL